MSRSLGPFLVFAFIVTAGAEGLAYRCGNHLVQEGAKTFEVRQKCGDPVSEETVGYTLKGDRRELEIKEWIYGPKHGVYYYLTFHGTELVDIESRRDPR
jgi:hypothetical protein